MQRDSILINHFCFILGTCAKLSFQSCKSDDTRLFDQLSDRLLSQPQGSISCFIASLRIVNGRNLFCSFRVFSR